MEHNGNHHLVSQGGANPIQKGQAIARNIQARTSFLRKNNTFKNTQNKIKGGNPCEYQPN